MGNYGNPLLIDSSVAGLPLGATSLVAHPMDADITTLSLEFYRACSGSTYIKIGTIQRRLAWPLRKDDTQIREAFQIFDPPPLYTPLGAHWVILKSVYANKISEKAYGTRCSQAVPHPSTILARRCLTSVIRRERVCSSWYGRRRSATKCYQSHHEITVIEQATSPTWCEPNFLDRSELMSTDKKYQTSYSH